MQLFRLYTERCQIVSENIESVGGLSGFKELEIFLLVYEELGIL